MLSASSTVALQLLWQDGMIHGVTGFVQVNEYCTSQCAVIHVLKELVIQVDYRVAVVECFERNPDY